MARRSLTALVAVFLLCTGQASAGETTITIASGTFSVRLTSLAEALFKTVVRQQHDFSCGSAALATLLTYHYDRPVSEDAVFQAMFESGDRQAIQSRGFSMADMQRYLATLGFHADGFKVPLDTVAEAGVPAITLINTRGYNHFVVIKGIKDGDVLLGDPAAGLRAIPRKDFDAMSQGIVFVIRDDLDRARQHFNRPEEWMVRRRPLLGAALDRQVLSSYLAALPGLHEF